ncbi:rCG26818 [Rattus norvegicus]|uniref:RCG26818 n=1 Tax=Rattus norvegicus TaxID=10116 RepID=A6HQL3_RAT|nr:rCG26818 [Rattus norvegicus]
MASPWKQIGSQKVTASGSEGGGVCASNRLPGDPGATDH